MPDPSLSPATVLIRAYRPADRAAVLSLWDRALGQRWPVSPDGFDAIAGPRDALVAERAGTLVGYVAARIGRRPTIVVVLVAPACQREGLGSQLLQAAVAALLDGATEVWLGAGAGVYFWGGVPDNLPAAGPFFDAHGWSRQWVADDLMGNIESFQAPAGAMARAHAAGVVFELAHETDVDAVVNLQQRHFPQRADIYRQQLAGPGDVLVARHEDGRMLGTCTLQGTAAYPFPAVIDGRVGSFAAVGVSPNVRGQGIGLALVARAIELLAQQGYDRCFVGYIRPHLTGWYTQLGFEKWRTHQVGALALTAPR